MKPISPCPRPMYRALIAATAVSAGVLLVACGGGGGGGGSSPPPPSAPAPAPGPGPSPAPAPGPAPAVSEADATADAANAIATASASSQTMDAVFDTTAALALAVTAAPSASIASAGRTRPQDGITTDTEHDIACPGGGKATFVIGGADLATLRNGVFDAGETYTLTYAACRGSSGSAQLDGNAELDVTSVPAGLNGTSPATTVVTIKLDGLIVTLGGGTVTASGNGTLSRTSITTNSTTTTTSVIASTTPLTLASTFNSRSGSFTVTNLATTRTATGGTSTYTGTHVVSGTANGRSLSFSAATTAAVAYDVDGLPVSGSWKVTRSDATIQAALADGSAVLTIDDGSDGTVDDTFTTTLTALEAAAG